MGYNELYHHGIKGMKWGVRRYQNPDGTRIRSSRRSKIPDSEDSKVVQSIRKKKISQMSNAELQTANKRLNLEKQYKDLTRKKSKGQKAVQAYIKTAGTITAVVGATAVYAKYGKQILKKIGSSTVT